MLAMPRYVFSQGDVRVQDGVDLSTRNEHPYALKTAYLLVVDPPHAALPSHTVNNKKETSDAE
jgi:hypothetical protein